MSAAAPGGNRWLMGPALDLLLGCGLFYLLLIAVYAALGPELRAVQPIWLFPVLITALSMPHYGATIVRVYERRVDRRGYVVFSLYTTVALLAAFVAGLHIAIVGALLVTLYLTWSPWHYTGQNYGIAVMFLRRRGVEIPPRAKRLLYASFILSYGLVFVVFHGSTAAPAYGLQEGGGSGSGFLSLGIPAALAAALFPLLAAAYVASAAGAMALLLRGGARVRDLGPSLLLVFTQAVWFSVPYALRHWDFGIGLEPLDSALAIRDYALWIALGHAAQYLWVTTYYARRSPGWHGSVHYLGKALAAGAAIWTLPVILFSPDALGPLTYGTGLALIVASTINIHHFILDGAIWKLKDQRIASILIRKPDPDAAVEREGGSPRARLARAAVWGVACASLTFALYVLWEKHVAYPQAISSRDFAGASAILDRMAWLGRDSAEMRSDLGLRVARTGNAELALRNYERARFLDPTPRALQEMGAIQRVQRDWSGALETYLVGLELAPADPRLLRGAGISLVELDRPGEAIGYLERVLEKYPAEPLTLEILARARAALGDGAADAPANPS